VPKFGLRAESREEHLLRILSKENTRLPMADLVINTK
jgi:hypothetical protein